MGSPLPDYVISRLLIPPIKTGQSDCVIPTGDTKAHWSDGGCGVHVAKWWELYPWSEGVLR